MHCDEVDCWYTLWSSVLRKVWHNYDMQDEHDQTTELSSVVLWRPKLKKLTVWWHVTLLSGRLRSCQAFPGCQGLLVRLNGEKRGRWCATFLAAGPPAGRGLSAAAGAGVDISAVFGVDPFLAHGRQLASLGHEHDDESNGSAGHQATADADILKADRKLGEWNWHRPWNYRISTNSKGLGNVLVLSLVSRA